MKKKIVSYIQIEVLKCQWMDFLDGDRHVINKFKSDLFKERMANWNQLKEKHN